MALPTTSFAALSRHVDQGLVVRLHLVLRNLEQVLLYPLPQPPVLVLQARVVRLVPRRRRSR